MQSTWFTYDIAIIQSSDLETYTATTKVVLSRSENCSAQLACIDKSINELIQGFIQDSVAYTRYDDYHKLVDFLYNIVILNERWLEIFILDTTIATNRFELKSAWRGNTMICDTVTLDKVLTYLTANLSREGFNFKRFKALISSKHSYLINVLINVLCNTTYSTRNESDLHLLLVKFLDDSKFVYKRNLATISNLNTAIGTIKTRLPKRVVLKVISDHQDQLTLINPDTICKMCKLNGVLVANLSGCRCLQRNVCAACSYVVYTNGICLICNRLLDADSHISLIKVLNIDVDVAIQYPEIKYYLDTMYQNRR